MKKAQIRRLLYSHYEFRECILEDVKWLKQGAVLELSFNYIWADCDGYGFDRKSFVREGTIRSNLEVTHRKKVRFIFVEEFRVRNSWGDQAVLGELGGGASEVACIEVVDDDLFLASYRGSRRRYHHVAIRWEGDRRIDVVFEEIRVG